MKKIGDLFPPTIDGTVYIELTHKCNFKCKHCYANCPQPKEMTFEQVKYLSKILKKEGFKKILLTGGEPLLVKDIKKIVDLLKKDFKVILITNGTLIKKVDLDYKKLDGLYISYDGSNEEEYKLLRGKKGFSIVQENIKWLVSQKIKVGIGIILSKYNLKNINKIIKQVKDLKVDKINLTLAQPFGRALKNKHLLFAPEKYFKLIPKLSKMKNVHFESMLCYPKELKNNSKEIKSLSLFDKYLSGCAAGKKFIYINPEGYVTPCGYITADKKLLKLSGNIFKQSLKEIYQTPLFQFFMNRSWESLTGKCTRCDYSIVCKGGCPLRAYNLKGNPQLPDPWCRNNPQTNTYLDYNTKLENFEKIEELC